ncbi:hypothetical protein ACTJKP_27150, partial [Brucella sp. 22210]
MGAGSYVVNAGTVAPGSSSVDAIEVVGSNATLELRPGTNIQGGVKGYGDTKLVLNATQAMSMAMGSGYGGFGSVTKTGAETLTLTGASGNTLPWRIEQGFVSFAQENSFGNSASSVTLAGGGLQFGADMTVSRKYVLESGSAALDTAGHAVILSNNI